MSNIIRLNTNTQTVYLNKYEQRLRLKQYTQNIFVPIVIATLRDAILSDYAEKTLLSMSEFTLDELSTITS